MKNAHDFRHAISPCIDKLPCVAALYMCFLSVLLFILPAYSELNQKEKLKRAAHQELEKGLKAFKSKNLRQGIQHYERAYRLAPDHQTLFTIAHAYGRLPNSCEKALQSWERLVMRCQGCDLKSKIQEGYRASQAKCNVKLRLTTPMPGAEVSINDESYGETPLSILLPQKDLHMNNY